MRTIRFFFAVFLLLFVFESEVFCGSLNRISQLGKQLFLSGMNLTWIHFANDLGNFDEAAFVRALDDISRSGGNVLRWWLHTNGRYSPLCDATGRVSGLGPNEIANLKRALDLAHERGMVLCLCLWSFDMLESNAGEENHARNKNLIENVEYTRAYVDNALVPMVQAVKDHPALLCWEICNEPEGMTSEFGWTPVRTKMKYIQQFINITADAIHGEDPKAKVTTGSWCMRATSDVDGFTNYYRDDRLIQAGNGLYPLGTLDFYQVHFFPQNHGEELSPFHWPASHWELDKPIVIGEFPAKGLYDFGEGYKPSSTLTTREAYEYAYNNGYAGAWSWSCFGHDINGDFLDAAGAMQTLYNAHSCDLVIPDDELILPRIAVNGQEGPVTVAPGEPITVAIGLALNGRRGQNADWWVAAVAGGDVVCYFDLNAGSMVQGLAPTYQGPLVSLNDMELIRFQHLPVGMYTFYFGIDLNMNGTLDACSLQYGAASVSVEVSNLCE